MTDILNQGQNGPKKTSFEYGADYQQIQLVKHRERKVNHWKHRIRLLDEMVDEYIGNHTSKKTNDHLVALDVGCSIGTISIELALKGLKVHAVDFDGSAIDIAKALAAEEGVSVEFHCCDVSELSLEPERKFDLITCFDIFEHLHDDELGALLRSLKPLLADEGLVLFYSFPLEYDYLFYARRYLHWPLLAFRFLEDKKFTRVARAYASMLDAAMLLMNGVNYKEKNKRISHCNPTTQQRLEDIFSRAGYKIESIKTENLYKLDEKVDRRFRNYSVAHRNIFGSASPE